MSSSRIIVALDFAEAGEALAFATQLDPKLCKLKVGKELFVSAGPRLVSRLVDIGFEVFLDLKFHDIPNTVAGACAAAAELGVWMVNVHASGGRRMMEAARERLEACSHRPLLVAVTVLTSMTRVDLAELGLDLDPAAQVGRLAALAQRAGLDGVVCSPQETAVLREQLGKGFCLVTPGVRPAGASQDDQARVMTPRAAIANGADYLVIGRPITRAPNPIEALQAIQGDIAIS